MEKTQKNQSLYANKGDLTTGSIPRHLIRLTLPMTWGILAVIAVQLTDTYFVSLLGSQELAGISFTFPITLTITHLLFGLNIALSSVISRLLGAGEKQDAQRVVLHGIMLAFTLSSLVALLCYIFLEKIFVLMGAEPEIFIIIKQYMPLWLIGSVLLSVPVNGNSAIRAAGDAIKPAMVMTTAALVNVILDPIMIFGHFGFPAMGVKGAALASMLSYAVALIFGLYLLIFDKKIIALDGFHLDKFKDSMRRLLFIAIPAGLTNAILPITSAVIVGLLATYGHEAVAAYGVASRIEAFAMLIVIALSVGMGPIIGQNWGAKNYQRVHETINKAIIFNLLWSLFVATILAFLGKTLAGLFTKDPQIIDITALYFWIVPFSYGIGNLVFGWSSAFNALGMPKRSFIMIVVRAIVLTIPAVYLGAKLFDVAGIFIAIAMVNLASGILFHILSWQVCLKTEGERQA